MNKRINSSPLGAAERFTTTLANARASALETLKTDLIGMDERQLRQCAEHLCELIVDEDSSVEVLRAVFNLVEAIGDTPQGGLHYAAERIESQHGMAI